VVVSRLTGEWELIALDSPSFSGYAVNRYGSGNRMLDWLQVQLGLSFLTEDGLTRYC